MYVEKLSISSLNALRNRLFITRCFCTASASRNCLNLYAAANSIPHPEKKRGEDAFFTAKYAIGVADGVGGWREQGVDPGEFSRSLVHNIKESIQMPIKDKDELKHIAIAATERTCREVRLGSSTLCMVACGEGNKAFFYNMGDSGFYVFRFGFDPKEDSKPTSKEWFISDYSPKQCHSFNFPFQLGSQSDSPSLGTSAEVGIMAGDLCLIASDGVFDNIWPRDILYLLNSFWKEGVPREEGKSTESILQEMVNAITGVTLKFSCGNNTTPFEHEANQQGYKYTGGKPDDITAVLALFKWFVCYSQLFLAMPTVAEFLDAARYDELDQLREIVQQGMNVDSQDEYGTTALHNAATNGNIDCMRFLIQSGCRHLKNTSGNTPLHRAVLLQQLESVALLLNSYPDISVVETNNYGKSAVDIAFQTGNEDMINVLLKHDSAKVLEQKVCYENGEAE